ncbi:hypothetical protein ACFL2K_04760 [Candidatus Margulisiibacteriota bacterium]
MQAITSKKVLDRKEIENYIPHRYENILLDSCTTYESKENNQVKGEIAISITENDSLKRNIFSKTKSKTKKTISVPIFMEILALASIVCTDKMPPGYLAFFVIISNFERQGEFLVGDKVKGTVERVSKKQDFYKYRGELIDSKGNKICQGEIFAAIQDVSEGMPDSESKKIELPAFNENIDIRPFNKAKDQRIFLCDEVIYFNPNDKALITKFTFKNDFATNRGHFPGNPVMMGVLQWMLVEDAVFALAHILSNKGQAGKYQVECNAQVLKDDGTLVADLKKAELEVVYNNDENSFNYTEFNKTKKMAFREIINPEQVLYVKLENVVIKT